MRLSRTEKKALVASLGAEAIPQEFIIGAFQKGIEYALTGALKDVKVCSLVKPKQVPHEPRY